MGWLNWTLARYSSTETMVKNNPKIEVMINGQIILHSQLYSKQFQTHWILNKIIKFT